MISISPFNPTKHVFPKLDSTFFLREDAEIWLNKSLTHASSLIRLTLPQLLTDSRRCLQSSIPAAHEYYTPGNSERKANVKQRSAEESDRTYMYVIIAVKYFSG